jgi:hypothetical protein
VRTVIAEESLVDAVNRLPPRGQSEEDSAVEPAAEDGEVDSEPPVADAPGEHCEDRPTS